MLWVEGLVFVKDRINSRKTYLAYTKYVRVSGSGLSAVEKFTHTWEAEEAVESDDDGAGNTDLAGGRLPPYVRQVRRQ